MSAIRAVFMGSDEFSLPILTALLQRGAGLYPRIRMVGVVTQPDRPAGRGRTVSGNRVKLAALQAEVPVLQPERVREDRATQSILALQPDVIVVASFGQILPVSLLETPRFKCVNLHPSLLPKYRGASPVVEPILHGDRHTGTTLMLVTKKMDAGPILQQASLEIREHETAGELLIRLSELSVDTLLTGLPKWVSGLIRPRPQDESQATYTAKLEKKSGLLDWTAGATELARKVRAFNPWPTAYTFFMGRQFTVLRAAPVEIHGPPGQVAGLQGDDLVVGTGEGSLAIRQAQLAGGKPLPVTTLVRGTPALLTAQFPLVPPW